jgi:hypothetical protein
MRCATVALRHVDTQEKSLMLHRVTVKTEEVAESLVAHTPVPLPHIEFRAQISLEFSMVSTVYTRSMGTYWVRPMAVSDGYR